MSHICILGSFLKSNVAEVVRQKNNDNENIEKLISILNFKKNSATKLSAVNKIVNN